MSKVTKMVVVSSYAPILSKIYKLQFDLTIKETCFGVLISGEEEEMKRATDYMRNEFGNGVFIKERGFPMGDVRRCRADRGGGARPGFYQLEREIKMLPLIEDSLNNLDEEVDYKIHPYDQDKKMNAIKLQKMIEGMYK
ncbi:MAG: methanogenesis marker 6 protein [Candidatus Methanolliviera sp. GoM_oil]|nr:MAG: methanogenesis marker 6 protein [Candidatus Methanolliviera sp. GoM_oil]